MLLEQIKTGNPVLWIKTPDCARMVEYIVNSDLKNFYTMDLLNGFSGYCKTTRTWKPILVEMLDPSVNDIVQKTTDDFSVALHHMVKNDLIKNSCFIHQPFGEASMWLMSNKVNFEISVRSYRNAFYKDSLDDLSLQHVIVCSLDCPKDVYDIQVVEPELMGIKEINDILHHLSVGLDINITTEESQEIARASVGLSEFSFINLSLLSLIKNNKIDPKYIYEEKMRSIKKNGILEIVKPKITFQDIGGLDYVKDLMRKNVWLWNNPKEAERFGVEPLRRILMVGVPGTGKSAICEATASEMGLDLARTGVSQVMNSFVGQSEANMRSVFFQIKAMAPLCVWIDEFGRDLSGGSSSHHVDAGTTDRVHGEFLTGLQELPNNVFLLCAANQIENLKPEMLRADRFDKIIFVGLPAHQERKSIFEIYLKQVGDGNFDYEALAEASSGFTGAEIKSLVKETKFYIAASFMRSIQTNDILEYIPKIRNILWNKNRAVVQSLYTAALEQWDFASAEQLADAQKVISGNYSNFRSKVGSQKGYNW
jgi:ATP-dependent Zn protease